MSNKSTKRTPTKALPPISALLFVLAWCLVGVLLTSCSASGGEGGGLIPDKVWDEVRNRLEKEIEKEIEKATSQSTPPPETSIPTPILQPVPPTETPIPTPILQPEAPKPEPVPIARPKPKPPTVRNCGVLKWNDGRNGMLFVKSEHQPGWKYLAHQDYGRPGKVIFCYNGKCENPFPPEPKGDKCPGGVSGPTCCGGFANPDQGKDRWHVCTRGAATEIRVDDCPPLRPSAKCLKAGRCD